jgi:crossover junction endodeoxyribonuclease RusA
VTWRVEAFAPGQPRPQGSKRPIGKGRSIEASKYLPKWRRDVAAAITAALPIGWAPCSSAVLVLLDFALTRPKYLRGRPTPPHVGKPDWDKLARAVMDATTEAKLWDDDSRSTGAYVVKRYAEDGEPAGVRMVFVPAVDHGSPGGVASHSNTPSPESKVSPT